MVKSQTVPPPATPNWRDHGSDPAKAALLPIGWGECTSMSLWYDMGTRKELTQTDQERIKSTFFAHPSKGRFEVVRNAHGRGFNWLLHVHGDDQTLHSSVQIGDQDCMLYQYGGSGPLADPSNPGDVINFAAEWD